MSFDLIIFKRSDIELMDRRAHYLIAREKIYIVGSE